MNLDKPLVESIHTGDDFQHGSVCMWKARHDEQAPQQDLEGDVGDGVEQPAPVEIPMVLECVRKMQQDTSEAIGSKCSSLEAALGKNPAWEGAMTKVETSLAEVDQWPLNGKVENLDSTSAGPWIASMRPFAFRCGPHTFPMPGVGAFIAPVGSAAKAGDLDMFVVAIKVEAVLEQGIALSDLGHFLGTPSGEKVFASHGVVLPLAHGSLGWVPYGFAVLPCAMYNTENKVSDRERKDQQGRVGSFWVFSPQVTEWAQEVPGQVWKAIVAWNLAHMTKMTSSNTGAKAMWESRKKAWAQFFEASSLTPGASHRARPL